VSVAGENFGRLIKGDNTMLRTWILVAESSRAKLYSASSRKGPLTEVDAFVHPEGRLHAGDLVSDRAGSDGGSVGQGRHVVDDKSIPKKQENINFAKEIADYLEGARTRGTFRKLILIAPPAFLGLLRDNLSKEVRELVTEQIDKNLVQQPATVVREHLSMAV
jgi:protein required for attachment to host cells